jgi:hypothetical protein
VSTIYLALALALCVAILMLVYWAISQIPALFSGGGNRRAEPQAKPEPRRRRSR